MFVAPLSRLLRRRSSNPFDRGLKWRHMRYDIGVSLRALKPSNLIRTAIKRRRHGWAPAD